MLVTKEELQKRLDAAWKLDPDEPGGAKEPFVAAMDALLADAEALGDPDMLFKVRLGYTYSMRSKPWKKHSREVIGETLRVLRQCLLMWQ